MIHAKFQWLGEIPDLWKFIPLSEILEEVKNKNTQCQQTQALKFTYGEIVKKENFEPTDDYVAKTIRNYTIVKPGDIVINGLNLNFDFITRRVGLVNDDGVITSAYIQLRLKQNSNCVPLYITYLLKSYDAKKAFHNMGEGVRKILNFTELKKLYIPCPSKDEQLKIVEFISKNLRSVEHTIHKIEESIIKLQKYKQSIITQAVTKGLDPNVEMKDSGVEWIGKIPKAYRLVKIKYLAKILNGDRSEAYPKNEDFVDDENGVPFFTSNELHNFIINKNSIKKFITKSRLNKMSGVKIKRGDILYCLRGSVGLAAINMDCDTGTIASSLTVIRSNNIITSQYINFCLQSLPLQRQAISEMNGSCAANLSAESVSNFYLVFPDIKIQINIIKYLNNICCQIDCIILQKQKLIAKLEEYKKSLIYEYVTGKKTVGED